MPTVTVSADGTSKAVNVSAVPMILNLDPTLGIAALGGWQGCNRSLGDNHDSVRVVNPAFGRPAWEYKLSSGSGTTDQETRTCKNANHTNPAVTSPHAVLTPDLDCWVSVQVYWPKATTPVIDPTHGGQFMWMEVFGTPAISGSGPALAFGIVFNNQLALYGVDYPGGVQTTYTFKNFGTVKYDVWHDLLLHLHLDSMAVAGGQNVSAGDGTIEAWYGTSPNPRFTKGSPVLLSSSNPRFGSQSNVTRLKSGLLIPGKTYPSSGSGKAGLFQLGYTGPQYSTWPNGEVVFYHGGAKIAPTEAAVTG